MSDTYPSPTSPKPLLEILKSIGAPPAKDAGGYTNVTHYGAIGDGVTDNTAIINAAIVSLHNAGGGTLYFPPGTYKANIVLDSYNVDLTGAGADSVLSPYNANLPIVRLLGLPGGERLRRSLYRLCFIGPDNYATNTLATCVYMNGWAAGPISYCTFKNFHTAIYSNAQEWHQIEYCMFRPGVCALAFVSKNSANDIYGNAPLFNQHPTAGSVTNCSFNCDIAVYIDSDFWKSGGATDCGNQLHFVKNDHTGGVCSVISRNGTGNPTQPLVFDTCWTENVGTGSTTWLGTTYTGAVLDIVGGRVDIRSGWLYGKYVFSGGCLVNYIGCQVVGPIDVQCDKIGNYFGLDSDALNTGQAIHFAKCNDVYDFRCSEGGANATLALVRRAAPCAVGAGLSSLVPAAGLNSGIWGTDNGQTVTTPAVSGLNKVYQFNFVSALTSQLHLILPFNNGSFHVVSFLARRVSGANADLELYGAGFSGCKMRLTTDWQQYAFVVKASGTFDYWRWLSNAISAIQIAEMTVSPFETYEEARNLQPFPVFITPYA